MRLAGHRLDGPDYALRAGLACIAFIAAKLVLPRLLLELTPVRICVGNAVWICNTLVPWLAVGLRWAITLGFLWVILKLNSARWEDARFPIWLAVYPLLFLLADLTWGITLRPLSSLLSLTSAIPPPPLALLAALAFTAVLAMLPSHDDRHGPEATGWRNDTTQLLVLGLALAFAVGELMLLRTPQLLLGPGRALGLLHLVVVVPLLLAVSLLPLVLIPATARLVRRHGLTPAVVVASCIALLAVLAAVATATSSLLGHLARLSMIPDTIVLMQVRGIAATIECGLLLVLMLVLAAVNASAEPVAAPALHASRTRTAPLRRPANRRGRVSPPLPSFGRL